MYLYGLYWGFVVARIDIYHIHCIFCPAGTAVCVKLMRWCGTVIGIRPYSCTARMTLYQHI